MAAADEYDAAALGIAVGDPVLGRPFTLRGAHSGEPWAFALAAYPLQAVDEEALPLLLGFDFVTDEELARSELTAHRRLPRTHPRPRRDREKRDALELALGPAVLDVHRTAHATITPFSTLSVATVVHRFEIDDRIDV